MVYKPKIEPEHPCCLGSTEVDNDIELWHINYAHLAHDNLELLHNKSMIIGMHLKKTDQIRKDCESCAFGKQNRESLP